MRKAEILERAITDLCRQCGGGGFQLSLDGLLKLPYEKKSINFGVTFSKDYDHLSLGEAITNLVKAGELSIVCNPSQKNEFLIDSFVGSKKQRQTKQ